MAQLRSLSTSGMIHKRWENIDHNDYAQRIKTNTYKYNHKYKPSQGSKLVPDEKMAGMHAIQSELQHQVAGKDNDNDYQ